MTDSYAVFAIETDRIAFETDRIVRETDRIAFETDRIVRETDRIAFETDRIVRETDRIAFETDRILGQSHSFLLSSISESIKHIPAYEICIVGMRL